MLCVIDRSAQAIEQATKELPSITAMLEADVSNVEQVRAAVDEAIERMGSIDVLIRASIVDWRTPSERRSSCK